MEEQDKPEENEQGNLRRWVANLQLESWQLELLITGFSIFLLASSIGEYDAFRRELSFNKLSPNSGSINPILAASAIFVINTLPWALKFFLINLFIHLLLRGFWIGIVGLSSVSAVIDFDKLKLQGDFRKFIPRKVRSLDQLILFLDRVSSVIFAYTYLLVFSILSVVIVASFIFALFGFSTYIATLSQEYPFLSALSIIILLVILLVILGALIFFLDTILFSAFKKSRWFSSIYYPIYRFFSLLSLSFIYRSIYYHLITNYKKKHIITVSVVLLLVLFVANRINAWDIYPFFPDKDKAQSASFISDGYYDDTRSNEYIKAVSIPSKFIKNGFLEVFMRYDPGDNAKLAFLCPDSQGINKELTIMDGMRAGIASQQDSTLSVEEILSGGENYEQKVESSVKCASGLFEIKIDNVLIPMDLNYHIHKNHGEKGFLSVLDVSHLSRGKHVLSVKKLAFTGNILLQDITNERLEMQSWAKISFWKE